MNSEDEKWITGKSSDTKNNDIPSAARVRSHSSLSNRIELIQKPNGSKKTQENEVMA